MNKMLVLLLAGAAFSFVACAQKKSKSDVSSSRTLVVYFSATGTTAQVAQEIADVTGGKLCEIVPEKSYTAADLDWNDKQSRSSVEMNDPKARPALKPLKVDLAEYDAVFIGYPIWWDQAPRVVNTFVERYALQNKKLIPFATSGGSSVDNSVAELRRLYPKLDWQNGRLLNGASRDEVKRWAGEYVSVQ